MEISSAVERMVLRGGSKLGKNETYDADTLIIHDTACAYISISPPFTHFNIRSKGGTVG